MKYIFLCIGIFLCLNVYGQTSYKKGYFITNNDVRVECLIKNTNWRNNPTIFKYELDGERKEGSLVNVKEFCIPGELKYIRFKGDIDMSSQSIKSLSKNMNPVWKERTVFLQFLIEGKANLYRYKEEGILKFFFSTESSPIEQLIYKKFLKILPNKKEEINLSGGAILENKKHSIKENKTFKSQLFKALSFDTKKSLPRLEYKTKSLVKYFLNYNNQ